MALIYRDFTGSIQPISDLESEGVAATDALCEDGFALQMSGGDLSRLKSGTAPILKNHDPDRVVARIIGAKVTASKLIVRWKYPRPGISEHADEVRQMVKDGFYTLSIGFGVEASEPIDPQRPRDGRKVTRWIAYEVSLVAVPADVGALVTTRGFNRSGKVLNAENAKLLQQAHDAAHQAHVAATRCRSLVRAVLTSAEIDSDSAFIQGPEGDHEDEVSRARARDRDFRRRQAEALALSAPRIDPPRDYSWGARQAEKLRLARNMH